LAEPADAIDGPAPIDLQAAAGASLQAEYERRMASREKQATDRFPRIGRLLLAVFEEQQSTRAFKQGTEGERAAVKRILADAGDEVLLLVNRRLGSARRRGDIDILAVTSADVRVIDVKRYKDATVRVESTGGLFSPRVEHLRIRGRDSTRLVDGLEKQVDAVRTAIAGGSGFAGIDVSAAFCFVDANLPLIGTPVVRGIPCLTPKGVARLLREATGPLGDRARHDLWTVLDRALPRA
jgi:hypothetical protein